MSTLHRGRCEQCGFTTEHAREAFVTRALRVHSCEKWRAKIAAQQRRAEKLAALDRTPKPCHHKIANHQHGTRACYVLDRCRCHPCSAANSAAEIGRERQKAYGRYDKYVPADRARDHVLHLMRQGMGLKQIAQHPGVSQGGLWKLIYGKRQPDGSQVKTRRILRTTEAAILAVPLELAAGAQVDGTGTRRRLQALVALGYPIARLAAETGVTNLWRTINGLGDGLVLKATADAVVDVYDRLSMTPYRATTPPAKTAATRARNLAASRGWLPPLAWDDDRIDDPTHTPDQPRDAALALVEDLDEAAIWRRMHGDKTARLSKADARELVRRWAASGRPLAQCEQITGVKPDRYYRLSDQEAS